MASVMPLRRTGSFSGSFWLLKWRWTDSIRVLLTTLMPGWFDSWS